MRVLRVFLKNSNQLYVEMPVSDDAELGNLITIWKMEGYLSRGSEFNGPPFAIPWDGWAFCCILQVVGNQPMATFEFAARDGKPN